MDTYRNKVAIVTGAGSGIGAAVAQALANAGALVICSDIQRARADETAARITGSGGRALALATDVTDAAQVAALVHDTVREHGHLDVMVNNAGITIAGEARDIDLTHWRRVLDVNLMGVVYGCDAAYKKMVAQGNGYIVNIASLAGLIPFPSNVPYATTKHAVVGLSLSLRAEGEAFGVKVSAVCPGFIQTRILTESEFVKTDRERALRSLPFTPVSPERAASEILTGMARNQAIISFPGYARWIWRLHRLSAALLNPFHRKAVADMRKLRLP